MATNAGNVMAVYEEAAASSNKGNTIFQLDSRWAMANPDKLPK